MVDEFCHFYSGRRLKPTTKIKLKLNWLQTASERTTLSVGVRGCRKLCILIHPQTPSFSLRRLNTLNCCSCGMRMWISCRFCLVEIYCWLWVWNLIFMVGCSWCRDFLWLRKSIWWWVSWRSHRNYLDFEWNSGRYFCFVSFQR
jgi:hypothetical protein